MHLYWSVKVVDGKQIVRIVMPILLYILSLILIYTATTAALFIACQTIALNASKKLKTLGAGTAKVEEHLQELFPDYDVIRVDRDSTSRVGSWQKFMTVFIKTNQQFYSALKCWQRSSFPTRNFGCYFRH